MQLVKQHITKIEGVLVAPTTYDNIFVLVKDSATGKASMRLFVQVCVDPEQQRLFVLDTEGHEFAFALPFDPRECVEDNVLLAVLDEKSKTVTPLGGPNSDLNPTLFE